jgi:hypothetical protein
LYSRYPLNETDEPFSRGHTHAHIPARGPAAEHSRPAREERGYGRPDRDGGILSSLGEGIGGFLRNLKLDWDSGDILLILIILFLSVESDDTEILILLALLLFF